MRPARPDSAPARPLWPVLALMVEDATTRSGGWDLGWEFAFAVSLVMGTWVSAPLVSLALALVTRRL